MMWKHSSIKGGAIVLALSAICLLQQISFISYSNVASPCPVDQKYYGNSMRTSFDGVPFGHNVSNLRKVVPCSEAQRKNISRIFHLDLGPNARGGGGHQIGGLTRCPVSTWLENYYATGGYHVDNQDNREFLGISVGCNKGHDFISMARMVTFDPDFDMLVWEEEIDKHITSGYACGTGKQTALVNRTKRDGEFHCIEPMPATFAALTNASRELGLAESKKLILTNAAISTATGTAQFPRANAGFEAHGIHSCQSKPHDCVSVPMYTLDEYARMFVQSKGPIDVLQIDVEGWDYDVLFGAGSVLDRTNYLEFEYHKNGPWGNLHLQDVVKLLDRKGFTCYWAGVANLFRITSCYFDEYDTWHGWSNVACVHRSLKTLSREMEEVFQSTIKDQRLEKTTKPYKSHTVHWNKWSPPISQNGSRV